MTESIVEIGGSPGVDRNTAGGGSFKREKGERHPRVVAEDDNVDISDEARSRARDEKHEGGRDHGADAEDQMKKLLSSW